MREKIIPLIISILMLVSLSIPTAIAQPPMPPCWFYGTVNVGGLPAQDNLNVTAVIRGTNLEWTTKTKNGTYGWPQRGSESFYVPSDDPSTPAKDGGVNGDIIEFYVNGVKTNQTAIFEYMSSKRVDIAVGSIPGGKESTPLPWYAIPIAIGIGSVAIVSAYLLKRRSKASKIAKKSLEADFR